MKNLSNCQYINLSVSILKYLPTAGAKAKVWGFLEKKGLPFINIEYVLLLRKSLQIKRNYCVPKTVFTKISVKD